MNNRPNIPITNKATLPFDRLENFLIPTIISVIGITKNKMANNNISSGPSIPGISTLRCWFWFGDQVAAAPTIPLKPLNLGGCQKVSKDFGV